LRNPFDFLRKTSVRGGATTRHAMTPEAAETAVRGMFKGYSKSARTSIKHRETSRRVCPCIS
jgi:hypothetical protein